MRNIIILSVIFNLSFTAFSYAHSHVESSVPKVGKTVAAPESVKITFSEKLRAKESFIKVFDSSKKQVNDDELVASDDQQTIETPLPTLKKGIYNVKWKAVCLCNDRHATKGSYKFSVE